LGVLCVGTRPYIPKGFCLLGMGKLGGREMNYGSDLDLLFIYGDQEAKEIGFETYLKLSETFTQVMASSTNHGRAYKVDARLRPMGREAQMIHSVAAYRQYFQTFAQSAERLAYTRAVYLAGDRGTATEVNDVINDFVYGRGLTRQEFDEILEIRQQMEEKAKKAEGLELKVSPGGIVDIEFFVQVLQVAYGKEKSFLRVPHVPTALRLFKDEGIVPPEVLDELFNAYRFYRLLEARHRMVRETGDDELPTDPERLKRLAWRAGLGKEKESAEKMLERIEETQKQVRALFNRLPEWLRFDEKS
jgi:glutamate-ammonia-ligase adenylyltransferase